jgi:hypothetical protein
MLGNGIDILGREIDTLFIVNVISGIFGSRMEAYL